MPPLWEEVCGHRIIEPAFQEKRPVFGADAPASGMHKSVTGKVPKGLKLSLFVH